MREYAWVKMMAFLVIMSFGLLIGGMSRFAAEWETGSWARADGTVTSVEVVELSAPLSQRIKYGPGDREPDRSPRYRSVVRYEYRVGDDDYVGSRISLHQRDHRDQDSAALEVAGYRPGQTVEVRYPPESPGRAFLKVGVRPWTVFVVLLGASLTLFAGFMLRSVVKNNGTAGWKKSRSRRRSR